MTTGAPGLGWRKRINERCAYWICRNDIAKSGYPIKSRMLWRGDVPTADEMAKINQQCSQLQHEMLDWKWKPRARTRARLRRYSGFVYFIRGNNLIKIGFATNIDRRMRSLQCSSSERLTLMGFIPGSPLLEKQLHNRFDSLREWGEWFRAARRLLDFIEKNTQEQSKPSDSERTSEHAKRVEPAPAL